jgi:hypothetical protein
MIENWELKLLISKGRSNQPYILKNNKMELILLLTFSL